MRKAIGLTIITVLAIGAAPAAHASSDHHAVSQMTRDSAHSNPSVGCRAPKGYIKDLRISTTRSGDTNRCFVAGFVAEKAPFVSGRHFTLAGNFYTDGQWYISKYTYLPHKPNQGRLGFTVRQTTGLGKPIGRTVVTFVLQTAAG
jgi:hypothetical protein